MSVGFKMMESLESRQMLSANATLDHGVLRVRGIEDAPNTIVVGNSTDGLSVNVSISAVRKNGVTKSFTASFPKTLTINKVRINGGHENDNITINQTASPFAIPTRIEGRGGADVVVGGDEADVIVGGAGVDQLSGCGGNDLIFGRHGNDIL